MGSVKRISSTAGRWAVALLCALASSGVQATPTVTYYHNDLLGSPVVATNASGQVIWRESYRPYGERLTNAPASAANDVWFTSRRQDVDTGLVYMGARYYDPVLGRFMSRDPVGFDDKNLHSFNRYAYANNNTYRYVDPNGRSGVPATTLAGAEVGTMVWPGPGTVIGGVAGFAVGTWGTWKLLNWVFNESVDGEDAGAKAPDPSSAGDPPANSNPYNGPVDKPVVIVDGKGNAIPVGAGEQVRGSPNGDYQQVLGSDGRPTGIRLDRGGHKGQKDPTAQAPHGHVPGVTTPDGNPHLPIK